MRSKPLASAIAAIGSMWIGIQTTQAASPPAASATITTNSTGATNSYSLTLSDAASSPSPIGTFWFAWKPGKDFMHTSPLSVSSPAGWTDTITGGGGTDGYAIEWVASSTAADVTANNSLSGFGFTSDDSPAALAGDSTFYPTIPVLTSFAYDAGPFSDAGTQFTVTPVSVPEPASLAILTPLVLLIRRSRRIA